MTPEDRFNFSFNQHKAYSDVGIRDDDPAQMSFIYNMSAEEYEQVVSEIEQTNAANAEKVCEKCGMPEVDTGRDIRIASLGDSITSYRMSYRCIIKKILEPFANITMKDFSVSGFKVTDLFTSYYPFVNDFAPDIATLMIGTNDMRILNDEFMYAHTPLDHFERDYDYLLKKLNDLGCRTAAVTLPPFCMKKMDEALKGWNILYTEENRKRYDDAIARIAEKNGAVLVDMREEYKKYDPYEITVDDGLHLNPAGQEMLAEHVYAAVKPFLR